MSLTEKHIMGANQTASLLSAFEWPVDLIGQAMEAIAERVVPNSDRVDCPQLHQASARQAHSIFRVGSMTPVCGSA
jgi:hypothetical protein